jgi:hypothetical protein
MFHPLFSHAMIVVLVAIVALLYRQVTDLQKKVTDLETTNQAKQQCILHDVKLVRTLNMRIRELEYELAEIEPDSVAGNPIEPDSVAGNPSAPTWPEQNPVVISTVPTLGMLMHSELTDLVYT